MSRFAGTLQPDHHDDMRFRSSKIQWCRLAQSLDQFFIDNLNHLLAGRQCLGYFRADGAFAHAHYEFRTNPYGRKGGARFKEAEPAYSYENEDQSLFGLRSGMRVRHAQFGVGTVTAVDCNGNDVALRSAVMQIDGRNIEVRLRTGRDGKYAYWLPSNRHPTVLASANGYYAQTRDVKLRPQQEVIEDFTLHQVCGP